MPFGLDQYNSIPNGAKNDQWSTSILNSSNRNNIDRVKFTFPVLWIFLTSVCWLFFYSKTKRKVNHKELTVSWLLIICYFTAFYSEMTSNRRSLSPVSHIFDELQRTLTPDQLGEIFVSMEMSKFLFSSLNLWEKKTSANTVMLFLSS